MARYIKTNKILIFIFALVLALSLSLAILTISNSSAKADSSWTEVGSVSVGHITDMHYYPFRLCYTGSVKSSDSDDYFYNYVMNKSTKMWLEAEMIFDASLLSFTTNTPDYIVISGDVGQDGELLSHVDVANKLRKLQNLIRAESGNDNFQIFVVMGNHDLYNEDTFRFDNANGLKETYLFTDRMDAVKIYAGLGYPNMTNDEAVEYYADMASDLPAGYTYVRSDLSSSFTYTWEFLRPDAQDKTITYDMSVNNADDVTMAKMLADDMVVTINNSGYFSKWGLSYRETNRKGGDDLKLGHMTFIAARNDGIYTCVGLDVVQSNAEEGHVLGGQLHNSTQAWLLKNKDLLKPNDNTVITGISHHSLLPHWSYEEQITTGFIVYNWQEVSDFLADLGMRYVYTGHMHANDTVSRVSFNGNQLTDFESASNLSVESQIKITNIKYGNYGASYAEKAMLSAYPNKKVFAVDLFDYVYKDDKYGYVKMNNLAEFLNYSDKSISNYSRYAQRRIYDNTVDNHLAVFLRPSVTEMLRGLVTDLAISVGPIAIEFKNYADDLVKLADNLIEQTSLVILKDYVYKGDNPLYKIEKNKVFGFLDEMLAEVLYSEVVENTNIFTVFMSCYMSHCTGYDVAEVTDLPKAYQAVLNELKSGKFVEYLMELLLDREIGLMRIIEGLSNTTLDLSKGISNNLKSLLNSVGGVLGFSEKTVSLNLEKFNLGEILKVLGKSSLVTGLLSGFGMDINLAENSLPEIIDDVVSKYITKSFTQSLGEYAYNIVVGFGVDGGHIDVHDDNNGSGTLITVYKGEAFTYIDKTRTEIITIENGKLPSMLTTNFGSDPSKEQNFTYFTDRRVKDSAIQYVKVNDDGTYNKSGATEKAGRTEVYGTYKTLIDLGIFCQTGYGEVSRHTISLTNLTPATKYAYRVGSADEGYWGEWYTFTTAPSDNKTKFSALITSDLQSSTQSAYQRMDKVYRDILASENFADGISFLINPGDVTDNGKNMSQFEWFINSSPDIYGSYSTVVAAGNHDEKHFELDSASNLSYYGGKSQNAITSEYNLLQMHYNYDLTAAQSDITGFYYSFDYSGVHFSVLNTNDIVDDKLSNKQFQWLKQDLIDSADKAKVVIMHKSLYSEGSHSYDKDVIGMRKQLSPLFAEQGVNLVIAGHDHTYTETYYLDGNGKKILTNANGKNVISKKGTMYLTMGTMGEKFYNFVDNALVKTNTGWKIHTDESKLADPVFGKLSYDGENLSYYGYQYLRTYNEDGSLKGGEIVEIKKSMDYTLLIGIGIVAITIVIGVVAVVVVAAKKRK